jgi:hypothetical protein
MEDGADVPSTVEHQVEEGFGGWPKPTSVHRMSLTVNG